MPVHRARRLRPRAKRCRLGRKLLKIEVEMSNSVKTAAITTWLWIFCVTPKIYGDKRKLSRFWVTLSLKTIQMQAILTCPPMVDMSEFFNTNVNCIRTTRFESGHQVMNFHSTLIEFWCVFAEIRQENHWKSDVCPPNGGQVYPFSDNNNPKTFCRVTTGCRGMPALPT